MRSRLVFISVSITKKYGILFGVVIIGLTGTIGAGKGTLVEYLLQHRGLKHYSVRDVLNKELTKRGLELTRDNMHLVGDELRDTFGAGYLVESLLDLAKEEGGNSVIESIRTIGEVQALRQKASDFYLFGVDADPKVRYERVHKRNSSTDNITFEKFQADEASESFHKELWRMNLPACIAEADYVLTNNGTVEEFYRQVEEVMKKV